MNSIKVKVYEKALKKVAEKYEGAENFINNIIDEIFVQEKLSAVELIYFYASFL